MRLDSSASRRHTGPFAVRARGRLAAWGLALLAVAASAQTGPSSTPAAETALLRMWAAHGGDSTQSLASAQAWIQFDRAPEGAFFRPVARGLTAWHLHRAGKRKESLLAWESLRSEGLSPLESAGNEMALRWLTRHDREIVREGLEAAWRRQLEYPAGLEGLGGTARPPLTDRWNRPWDYRKEGLQHIKGLIGQRYLLQSTRLGATSDLTAAMARPYGEPLRAWTPEPGEPDSPVVALRNAAGQRLALALGQPRDGLTLAHAGPVAAVLSDGDSWRVIARKAGP